MGKLSGLTAISKNKDAYKPDYKEIEAKYISKYGKVAAPAE